MINDTNVRDEIAAGIYYKDIGSRKGLTVAESDIEYRPARTMSKQFTQAKYQLTSGNWSQKDT